MEAPPRAGSVAGVDTDAPGLLPEPLRRPVAVVVAAAAVVFAVLASRFAGTSAAGRLDLRVDAVVDPATSEHHRLVGLVGRLGSPPVVVALAVVIAAVCLVRGRRRLALLAVAGPGLTGVATTVLKPVLGRTIGDGFAFPSGHTGGATAIALVAALLITALRSLGPAAAAGVLAAAAVVLGGGVGTAMVAGDKHYPTDTVGGFCTAVVIVLGGALLLDRFALPRPLRA